MLYQQIARNKRKTALIMFIFLVILGLVGAGIGYLWINNPTSGIIIALIGSLIYLFIMWQNPANMIMSLNHAQEIHEADNPELWHIVEDMAMVAQVPMPRVYIIPDPSPNAFATGRDPEHSAVAVTQGILELLDREELEGVLGHELSHVKNYDILLSTIAVVLVGVISFISNMASNIWFWGGVRSDDDDDRDSNALAMIFKVVALVFVLILGPLSASLAQMALSRNREYLADASSVKLTRNPQGLISALRKIENSQPMKVADRSSAGLYIENPFHNHGLTHLFDTHPPTADRIKRLENM
ncbi:zinc metalloprotease HtpX [Lactobacillus crispatus]|uniref:Protease HtpX homolog n=1 Tax=Lactobacillus crispatus TaxID=47770 RepID=A0A2I1WJI8_9LACO|nr:zinc metalloprotease HtpX [Lactobacillus crispatus]KAA8797667.1 zinc metalloprotease HtpX [Lactobacillus crispatus]KAA8812884.1 zinc metalloprotease HtpX [Lactobacillus crispatus]KRK34877.1 protease htpx like protein [Lactobacillus crispatus DSM 20584 = JCM 1185 = ATCC 33820]MBW9142929.1 zinc metalloprotease HtpX [Lactobacillus crispatus]MDK6502318.1 zinc metalloprotease HtpX [Lactobacillus crispatus]